MALFDLVEDPGETRDVAAAHPDVVAEHRRRLAELTRALATRRGEDAELSSEDANGCARSATRRMARRRLEDEVEDRPRTDACESRRGGAPAPASEHQRVVVRAIVPSGGGASAAL